VRELRHHERLRVRLLDLDALFQTPLAEFTKARNALAKSAGAGGDAIRKIEKPTAGAWAVNQIYWRHRRVYDKLVRASARVRAAHALILKGKRVDLAPLELLHRAAVKDASAHARETLAAAGDAATTATMKAVEETLQALPVAGPPGRLTGPLGPVGFDALGGLLKGAGLRERTAEVVAFTPPRRDARAEDRESKRLKAEAEARGRRQKALEASRRSLDQRLRHARVRVETLGKDLAAATADRDRLEHELHEVTADLSRMADV
jgi:hypothetical protein